MSSKADDKLIDAELTEPYLRGDSKYSTLYGEIETDDVPPALDTAVIAEAAAAIKPRKGFAWQRYTPMIAVAATAVLTVSVVLRSGLHLSNGSPDRDLKENSAVYVETRPLGNISNAEIAELPAPEPVEAKAVEDSSKREAVSLARPMSPAAAPPPPKLDMPAKKEVDVRVTGNAVRETLQDVAMPVEAISSEDLQQQGRPSDVQLRERNEFAQAGPRGTIPVQKAKAADKSAAEVERVQLAQNQSSGVVISQRAASAAAPSSAPSVSLGDPAEATIRQLNPGSWLAYIRELRIAGKTIEADKEWEKFVLAYPTYRVEANDAARPKAK